MARSFKPDNRIKNVGLLPARIFRWVGKHLQALTRRSMVVLKELLMHISCYVKGYCYPSVPTIARSCGYSVRTVQYALGELVEAGLISIERVPNKQGDWDHNYYSISADLVAEVTGIGGGAKPATDPPKGKRQDPPSTIGGGAMSADQRDLSDPKQLKERQEMIERIRQMKNIATEAARIAAYGAG